MRKAIWILLIASGVISFMWAEIAVPEKGIGAAIAVMSVASWIAFGTITSHFLSLKRKVLRHLGIKPKRGQMVSRSVDGRHRVDIQMAIDRMIEEGRPRSAAYGARGGGTLTSVVAGNSEPTAIEWVSLAKSLNETYPCSANGLYLLFHEERPFAVMVQAGRTTPNQFGLEVMSKTREHAQAALEKIIELANRKSVYRGSVISLEPSGVKGGGFVIKFHDMPPVAREAIVLPEEIMEVVERNVLGLLRHGEVLRRSGRGTRHGVLFHGPPGTGKTLVTRYLANACADYTVILLTGRQLTMIRESCQFAKMLSPSMVVLEDVDLVASERGKNRHNRVLHELLDEMDGLGAKSDCIFLLTTNRPDVLEPALAARPGRIDQAICFPLPDAECRRRLFSRLSAGLDISQVDVESLVEKTDGASPAFIQELFRKAALMAAERGERKTPLIVSNSDFTKALRELLEFGGSLTQNLLGFGRVGRGKN